MEDHAKELGVMVAIIVPLAFFAMTFGIVYLYRRERMAMVERGMNPKIDLPQPHTNLKWGLLLIGSGLGLFFAYLLDNTIFKHNGDFDNDANVAIYIALIAVFGGAGLFVSYLMDMKYLSKKSSQEQQ